MVASRMSGGAPGQGRIIDTGLKPVFSQKSTTGVFVPLTGALDSTQIKEARVAVQLAGITSNFKARPAYRMSDDGIVWSATVTNLTAYLTAAGWNYYEGAALSVTTDQRQYVQFGVEVANVSGSQVEHGQVQVRIQVRPTHGRTMAARQQKVWSDGTVTAIFNPLTDGVLLEDVGELRATLELMANSGDVQTQPAFQVSNDGRSWYSGVASAAAGTFTTFGANRTADGIDYGTTFASLAPSEKKQFVRFGVATKNGTAGKSETGMVNLRVDVRRT